MFWNYQSWETQKPILNMVYPLKFRVKNITALD